MAESTVQPTNFRLPTLRLGTPFDEVVVPLDLPAELRQGSNKALAILDGADRAPIRLSRMVRPVALLGIKTSVRHTAVRVRMGLLVDRLSTQMWDRERRRATKQEPERDHRGRVVLPDVRDKHRLIQISAQGKPRALALLSYRDSDGEFTNTRLEFEIGAEDVGESGLIMIDFDEPTWMPEWAKVGQLPGGLTGVCVGRIVLEEAGEPVPSHVSTGRPGMDGVDIGGRTPGYFVVNPSHDAAASRVEVVPHWADDERLLGKRAKVKHPMRAAAEWTADRRVSGLGPASVEVVDTEGNEVLSGPLKRSGRGYAFDLPAGLGPVYVRVRKKVGAGEPRLINWYVDVKPA